MTTSAENEPKRGKKLFRDNTRFAFWAPDPRPKLPDNFRLDLTPKPISERAARVLKPGTVSLG